MRTLTRISISLAALALLSCSMTLGQAMFFSQNVIAGSGISSLTATYVGTMNGSASVSTLTSPSISVTTGDVVVVMCRNGGNAGTYSLMSSAGDGASFGTLGLDVVSGPTGSSQAFYNTNATGGTNTYTCSTSSSAAWYGIVVIKYHPDHAMTLDTTCTTSCANSVITQNNWTSNTFSTSTSGIIIACGDANYSATASVGTINGAAPTQLWWNSTYCEGATSSRAQSGTTASVTATTAGNWGGFVIAFK